jgi:hypothetical protein
VIASLDARSIKVALPGQVVLSCFWWVAVDPHKSGRLVYSQFE